MAGEDAAPTSQVTMSLPSVLHGALALPAHLDIRLERRQNRQHPQAGKRSDQLISDCVDAGWSQKGEKDKEQEDGQEF